MEDAELMPVSVRAEPVPSWQATREAADVGGVDMEAVRRVSERLARVASGEEASGSQREWREAWQACYPRAAPRPAETWHSGMPEGLETGARIWAVEGVDRGVAASGGEANYLRRADKVFTPVGAADTFRIGEDEFATGWAEEAEAQAQLLSINGEGIAVDPCTDEPLVGAALERLEPGPQLVANSLRLLHEWEVVKAVEELAAGKQQKCTINLEVAAANVLELTEWQAKIRATAAFATDGAWVKGADIAARGFVRHDGTTFHGELQEVAGKDNYVAELAALIDALASCEDGGRVIMVVDALSPVWALLRFRVSHDRTKQQFYCDDLLDTLDQQLMRMEAVVFLWQTSHVGSPPNEAADQLADVFDCEGNVVAVPCAPARHYFIALAAPARSVREWASHRGRGVVAGWLKAAVTQTQFEEPDDISVGLLPGREEFARRKLLGRRRALADVRAFRDEEMQKLASAKTCPAGCRLRSNPTAPVAMTWSHFQFFCCAPRLQQARLRWWKGEQGGVSVQGLASVLEDPGSGKERAARIAGHHQQWQDVAGLLRAGVKVVQSTSADVTLLSRVDFSQAEEGLEVACRRAVGVLWRSTGDDRRDKAASTVRMVEAVGRLGLRVQEEADELVAEARVELMELQDHIRISRSKVRRWRARVCDRGPGWHEALWWWAMRRKKLEWTVARGVKESLLGSAAGKGLVRACRAMSALERPTWDGATLLGGDGCVVGAVVWWRIAAAVRWWRVQRWRAKGVSWRDEGKEERDAKWALWRRARQTWREARGADWANGDRGNLGLLDPGRCPHHGTSIDSMQLLGWGGEFRLAGVAEKANAADCTFILSGGRKELFREGARVRERRRLEGANRAAESMARYLATKVLEARPVMEGRCGGGGVRVLPVPNSGRAADARSLSGAALAPVGERWHLERAPPSQQMRRRAAAGRRDRREAAIAAAEDAQLRKGLEGTGDDRWAVQEVLDVGRSRTRKVWVLVRWAWEGEASAAWDDTWVTLAQLSGDLQGEARAQLLAREGGAKSRAPAASATVRAGWRKSPRLAAVWQTACMGDDGADAGAAAEADARDSEDELRDDEEEFDDGGADDEAPAAAADGGRRRFAWSQALQDSLSDLAYEMALGCDERAVTRRQLTVALQARVEGCQQVNEFDVMAAMEAGDHDTDRLHAVDGVFHIV